MSYGLAKARELTGLSQGQVAQLLNVRQERVSAIERHPSIAHLQIQTLAAYVDALGGRLEIMAHVNGEQVNLSR